MHLPLTLQIIVNRIKNPIHKLAALIRTVELLRNFNSLINRHLRRNILAVEDFRQSHANDILVNDGNPAHIPIKRMLHNIPVNLLHVLLNVLQQHVEKFHGIRIRQNFIRQKPSSSRINISIPDFYSIERL